jgi:hypothetical protein
MFYSILFFTDSRALHCVSSQTLISSNPLSVSVDINAIFRECQSNCSSFTTHHIFKPTYYLPVKECVSQIHHCMYH